MKADEKRYEKISGFCIGKILDVGCGLGGLKKYVENYVGLDIKGNVDVKASCYKLPFKNNSFDTVILAEILEHLENPFKALKEANRVAKKRIIITVPNPFSLNRLAYFIIKGYSKDSREHIVSFNNTNMEMLCKKLDLKIKKIFSYIIRIPKLGYIYKNSRFGVWSFYIIDKN